MRVARVAEGEVIFENWGCNLDADVVYYICESDLMNENGFVVSQSFQPKAFIKGFA